MTLTLVGFRHTAAHPSRVGVTSEGGFTYPAPAGGAHLSPFYRCAQVINTPSPKTLCSPMWVCMQCCKGPVINYCMGEGLQKLKDRWS